MFTPALRLTNTDSAPRAARLRILTGEGVIRSVNGWNATYSPREGAPPWLGCFNPQAALINIPHHGALFDVDARGVHPACDPCHR